MDLEEKIIDGVLHYRWYSNQEFKPYTPKELTSIIKMLYDGKAPKWEAKYNEDENSLDLESID